MQCKANGKKKLKGDVTLNFASYTVPGMICFIVLYGAFKKTNVYSAFTNGVTEGAKSVLGIFPALFAVFIAVGVFRASGLVDFLTKMLSPICKTLNFPPELLPFALLRPVSGSGSLAMASDLFSQYGPDSKIGRIASVMMGSTETTFYVVAVYFAASGTKNIRHSLKCALMADLVSICLSTLVCRLYF